mgnify:FL=1
MKAGDKRSYIILKAAKKLRDAQKEPSTSSVKVTKRKKKKHVSSFILYAKETMRTLPNTLPFRERQSQVSRMWNHLEPGQKSKYVAAALEQREQRGRGN